MGALGSVLAFSSIHTPCLGNFEQALGVQFIGFEYIQRVVQYHYYPITEHIHYPQRNPVRIVSQSLLTLLQPLAAAHLYSIPTDLPIQGHFREVKSSNMGSSVFCSFHLV